MDLQDMTKDELIEQNKALREELNQLKTKYVWGLQVEDFADAAIGTDESIEDVFSEDELSDDDLHFKAFHALRSTESYSVHEWVEDISESAEHFNDHTMKLLRTVAKRWLTFDEQDK